MAAKQPAGSSNDKKTKKKKRDDDNDDDDVDEVIEYTFSVGDLVNVAVPVSLLINPSNKDWLQPWISLNGKIVQKVAGFTKSSVWLVEVEGNRGFQVAAFTVEAADHHIIKRSSLYGETEYEIKRILKVRKHAHNKGENKCDQPCHCKKDFLIEWVGWEEDTWEHDKGVPPESIAYFNLMGKYAAAVNNDVLGFMKDVRGMDQVKLTRQAHDCKYFPTCDKFGQYCTERFDICLEDKTRNLSYRLMESYAPTKKTGRFSALYAALPPPPKPAPQKIQPTASKAGPQSASLPVPRAGPELSAAAVGAGGGSRAVVLPAGAVPGASTRSQICLVCKGKKSADDPTIVCKGCNKLVHAGCSSKSRNEVFTLCKKCVLKRCSECNDMMPENKTVCLKCNKSFCDKQKCIRVRTTPTGETGNICQRCANEAYSSPIVSDYTSGSGEEAEKTDDDQQEASKKQRLNPDVDLSLDKAADLPALPVPLSTGDTDRGDDNLSSEPESAVGQYLLPRPLSPAAADSSKELPPALPLDASFEQAVAGSEQAVPGSEPEPPTRELDARSPPEPEKQKGKLGLAASLGRTQQRLGFGNSLAKPKVNSPKDEKTIKSFQSVLTPTMKIKKGSGEK